MASKVIPDDELRKRLSSIPALKNLPIVDSTRPFLLQKLAQLQCTVKQEMDSVISEAGTQDKMNNPLEKIPMLPNGDRNDKLISKGPKTIKTFVFFDLEATGLPSDTRPPRVTELCFKAVDVEHFSSLQQLFQMYEEFNQLEEIFPRVINSLNLCFNPGAMVPDIVTDITGLSNDLLENQSRFKAETVQLLKLFLENLPQPICLVAHNGDRYDYPLLQAELFNTGLQNLIGEFYVIDSLPALKYIFDQEVQEDKIEEQLLENDNFVTDNMLLNMDESSMTTPETEDRRKNGAKVKKKLTFVEKPKSFSLPKLHEHIFGVKPKKSHGAEVDVNALIRVCAFQADIFVNYSQKNCDKLKNVKKMWVRKRKCSDYPQKTKIPFKLDAQ